MGRPWNEVDERVGQVELEPAVVEQPLERVDAVVHDRRYL
jgi:hypothetical protein